jgi:hypothetical protein
METRHGMVPWTAKQPGMGCIAKLEKATMGRCAAYGERPFTDTPEKTTNFFWTYGDRMQMCSEAASGVGPPEG